jgi:hypothetical protein
MEFNRHSKAVGLVVLLAGVVAVSGCAATHVAISKRELDVQTKMSSTIFLDPVPKNKQTIYLQVRNTSDRADFQIEDRIRAGLQGRGYKVVNDTNRAHYMLQVNILQVGKIDPAAAERIFSAGYGGAIAGAMAGAAIGDGSIRDASAGGFLGGIVETVSGAFVKDVMYSIITDLQISERNGGGWKRHQTRILSTANKVNLEFAEAQPSLEKGLIASLSGLF